MVESYKKGEKLEDCEKIAEEFADASMRKLADIKSLGTDTGEDIYMPEEEPGVNLQDIPF